MEESALCAKHSGALALWRYEITHSFGLGMFIKPESFRNFGAIRIATKVYIRHLGAL